MTNVTSTPDNQEFNMNSHDLIRSIFDQFIDEGGSPKVTEFKRHIDQLIKTDIKPLCSGRGSSAVGGDSWRDIQKGKFAGRGAKWQEVSLDEIALTLDRLDDEGIDTVDYRTWTEAAGKAWIRYAGPRVVTGVNMAAFEVRTVGSTYDCPKSLHYIADADLDDRIKPLAGTPHSLKLEVIATKKDEDVSDEPVSDETEAVQEEVVEAQEVEVNDAPTSDDPEEWEAFLEAEGLGADIDDEDDDLFSEV
jgi:hypothetical protein